MVSNEIVELILLLLSFMNFVVIVIEGGYVDNFLVWVYYFGFVLYVIFFVLVFFVDIVILFVFC